MTITSSGPVCDVCGDYILLDKSTNQFTIRGIAQKLHCHDKCKVALKTAGTDWKLLPEGPLRKVFEDQEGNPK